jgi:hypothetical protein
MSLFYSEGKTDLKARCDCCIKFQLFEGAEDIFCISTAVRCMLLTHKPYRVSQHYKRHVCGLPVAVNIDFLDIYEFWALVLSELYG